MSAAGIVPGFHVMRRVAPGSLLDLSVDCQPMPEQRRPQGRALVGRSPKMVDVEHRGDAGTRTTALFNAVGAPRAEKESKMLSRPIIAT